MISMIDKKFVNEDLEIELTPFIDNKQNVWFRGKDVAKILGYSDTDDALRRHVDKKYKIKCPQTSPGETLGQVRWYTFINEPGFYALVFGSKLQTAKKFQD